MEGADGARERRIARLAVSEEKKQALEQKLAAVRAGEALAELPAEQSPDGHAGGDRAVRPVVSPQIQTRSDRQPPELAAHASVSSERAEAPEPRTPAGDPPNARALQLETELRKRLALGELTQDQYKSAHDRLERSELVRRIQNGDDDFDESEQEKVRALKVEVKLRQLLASGELSAGQFKAAQDRFEQSNVVALNEEDEDDADVEERDQKPVVDWSSPPDAQIARVSRLYARPTYVLQTEHQPVDFWLRLDGHDHGLQMGAGGEIAKVLPDGLAAANGVTSTHSLVKVGRQRIVPDMPAAEVQALIETRPVFLEFVGGRMENPKRIVFDRADAKLDEKGWPTEVATNGQQPKPYPCCCLDVDELGMIGGVGMRLYFYLLSFLCWVFFAMAVVTTPSVVYMKDDNMYNHSEAMRYRTTLAETTLGNVKTPIEELQSSGVLTHKLWKISTAEALGSLVMLCMVLRASKAMARLVEKVDQDSVTMSDYTVLVEPCKPWKCYQSVGKNKSQQLIADLRVALESIGGQLAEINDEPCIWVAWNDRKNIALWNQKRATLIKLEAALFEARVAGSPDAAEKVMNELDAVNRQLTDLNAKNACRPVSAYASFNLAEHYEDALRANKVEVGGVTCTITAAPEPESVKWEHLEFSATQRKCRKFIIYLGTALALMIGAGAILYANSLKVGTSYIDYCSDVVGNASKDELASACPGVRTADGVEWSPGAGTDLAALYHNMFKEVHDHMGDLFVAEEGDDGPETVGPPEEGLPFAVCPEGERGTTGQPCHYIDTGLETTTEFLMARGDLDAMCYACICTLSSVDETIRTPLEDHLNANPTYLDQCYAKSDAATPVVDACAEVDLSDPATAKDLCEGAGECTYLKSDVQSYCEEMDEVVTNASFWGYVATVIVVVVNQMLKQGIKRSASFARSHTIEEEMVATSMRVYACQLLNTAILMLVLRSNFWLFHDLPGQHYTTVNAKWYAEVGAPLIQTMIIQFMTPPGIQIFTAILKPCLASKAAKGAATQNQLNASQQPHSFEVAAGYGEVMLAASVTMIFGSGIPLLYHVAAVGFFIRMNVEKFIIVKVTRKPPLYSKVLFDSFDELFAWLLLVHAAMATYFIASAGGLTPTSTHIYMDDAFGLNFTTGSSLFNLDPVHDHIWPIFVVFVMVLLGVSGKFLSKLRSCCRHSDAQGGEGNAALVPEPIPSFVDAYAGGLIINDDDDYVMDQYEDLMDLETAFQEALDAAHDQDQAPFGSQNDDFYHRVRHAVGAVPGEAWGRSNKDAPAKDASGVVDVPTAGAQPVRPSSKPSSKAPLPFRPPRRP